MAGNITWPVYHSGIKIVSVGEKKILHTRYFVEEIVVQQMNLLAAPPERMEACGWVGVGG